MSQEWKDKLESRLAHIQERIASATSASGRSPDTIRIVAISKGHPVEAIEAAQALGLEHIGENRIEEALPKQARLQDPGITWHMVGHIQSRKAVDIPGHFAWVHSIDRLKIAERINRFTLDHGLRIQVLLEVNVSGELTKSGWDGSSQERWPGLIPEARKVLALPGLQVAGLMTMAPWVQDPEILRSTFRRLRLLRDYLSEKLEHRLPELSMGMTDDYEIAIEEGATMVRLGRALFGPRG